MSMPLRIAVMGLGWVATHRHIPAILRNPAFRLVGVADRHEGKAKNLARRYGLAFAAQAENIEDISWLDQIDALVIGAPPHVHAKLAIAAMKAGKHVLTEKPFAMNLEEASAMAQTARQNKRILAVVHNFQFSNAMRRFEKDFKKGRFGNLKRVAAVQLGNPKRRLPSWYETLPLGLFFDESPHFFYLLQRIAGKIELKNAHSVASQDGLETPSLVHLLYKSEKGFPVTIDCQFDSAISEWFVRITGEKETAFLDIFRDIYVRVPNDNTHSAFDILRTSAYVIAQHLFSHIPRGIALLRGRLDYGNDEVFARFAKAVSNGTPPQDINVDAAFEVLKLQEEATEYLRKNRIQ